MTLPVADEQPVGGWIRKFAVRFSSAPMALDDQVIADHGTETPRRADRNEPSPRMVETVALASWVRMSRVEAWAVVQMLNGDPVACQL
ncbi:MAG TPA: hypothetical protein VJW23_03930 [Propionibacteriaceae bacterium]|nr:hypothetical protein [Propionibacteriaceae bacterium]